MSVSDTIEDIKVQALHNELGEAEARLRNAYSVRKRRVEAKEGAERDIARLDAAIAADTALIDALIEELDEGEGD